MSLRIVFGILLTALLCTTTHALQSVPLVPDGVDLVEGAARSMQAEWLTEDERSDLRVRHGVWNEADLEDSARAARAALIAWDLGSPVFQNDDVPLLLRAEMLMRRGRHLEALALLEGMDDRAAALIEAKTLEAMGFPASFRALVRMMYTPCVLVRLRFTKKKM